MSATKRVLQVWAVPLRADDESALSEIPGAEKLLGNEDPGRAFERHLGAALDWFRYGNGLYLIYTNKDDDFWRTRLTPAAEELLVLPVVEPLYGKMDKKFWRWLRDVLQFCRFERGDKIFVWPAGKPEKAVSGTVTGFTDTGRPDINLDGPMESFSLDGDFEFGREHPVADKPSEESVLGEEQGAGSE